MLKIDPEVSTVTKVETPKKTTTTKATKKSEPVVKDVMLPDTLNSIEKPITYKFYLDNGTEITKSIESPELTDSTGTLAASLTFKWVSQSNMLEVGDKVVVTEDDERIFNGIVVSTSQGLNRDVSVTCYDYAFYMNKSEIIIQFNGVRADTAIKQLLAKVNVPVGSICTIKTTITDIFYGETPAAILNKILEKAYNELGKNYRYEMRNNKFYVEELNKLKVDLSRELKYSSIQCTKSIEKMKNSILVVVNDSSNNYVYCKTQDTASINKYGLLQHVEKINADDVAKARNTMNVLNTNLNRVQLNFSIKLPIKRKLRSGRVFALNTDEYRVNGSFIINSCKKDLTSQLMDLEVGLIEAKAGV